MEWTLIRRRAELLPYLPAFENAQAIAVDTETTGLDPHTCRLRLVQLAVEGLPPLVLDCDGFLPEGAELLRAALATPAVKLLQNARFDLQFLRVYGIEPAPLFDTMLAAQLLSTSGGPEKAGLKALAAHYLGETLDKEPQKSDWSGALTQEQLAYAARDAQLLLRLLRALMPRLREQGLNRVARIEFGCARAVAQMEYAGMRLNLDRWALLRRQVEAQREEALQALYRFGPPPMLQMDLWGGETSLGDNYESNAFLLGLLRRNGIQVKATSKHDLAPYHVHPVVQAMTRFRGASKLLSGFLIPLPALIHPRTGRLHPRYGQIGAMSGRMSCWSPNIQQIPRDARFRACFDAPPGRCLVLADYAQIELKVAAQLAREERMLQAYRQGRDLHALTASLLLGKPQAGVTKTERQAAKAVNFGLIYGMGAAGLMQYARESYGAEMTLEQAAAFRERFFAAYPGIARWHAALKADPPRQGRSMAGRKFVYPGGAGVALASNTPVQGTAADIAKLALGRLAASLNGLDAFPVAMVHDEILLECASACAAEATQRLQAAMEGAQRDILPDVAAQVEVRVAASWAAK